jgi:magnesium-transporting ATPase (P-type)
LWLTRLTQDGFYDVAHWILASKYNQIASEIPYLLHEVSIPASSKACHQRMFWVFLILNTLPAILQTVLGIPFNYYTYIDQNGRTANFFRYALIAVWVLGFCLICVTCYVLMLSVYKIRKFYKENKLTAEMNTKAMLLHVLAFGSFVISALPYSSIAIFTLISPYSTIAYKAFEYSLIPTAITSTISQMLLCAIFWQFGGKLAAQPAQDS